MALLCVGAFVMMFLVLAQGLWQLDADLIWLVAAPPYAGGLIPTSEDGLGNKYISKETGYEIA